MMVFGLIGAFLLVGFLFLLLLAGGGIVTYGVTRHGDTRGDTQAATPRQILDARLARGEIDTDEYQKLRSQIDS